MAKVSQRALERRLEKVLRSGLRLEEPEFHFERLSSGRVSGNIISDTFKSMKDIDRQRRIWKALDAEFGDESTNLVGVLLAYTRAEWDGPFGDWEPKKQTAKTKRKKVG